MTEKAVPGTDVGEKLLVSVRQMKCGTAAGWIRDYGAKVLSERDSGVINPGEAEINAIVNDLCS